MSKKDVIYIDIEDDITAIIDKLSTSKGSIVALVLPKKAPVLHSIVNMKLLYKAATDAKKRLVLITGESSLLPLAGSVGIHVSETLQSRPEVPEAEAVTAEEDSIINAESVPDTTKSVGELETDTTGETVADSAETTDEQTKPKKKSLRQKKLSALRKNSKIKIPNFARFRLRIIFAVIGVIVFIIGWIFAYVVLPSATVNIEAQTSRIATDISFIVDTSATEDNVAEAELVATQESLKKNISQSFVPTGEKDVGQKAAGTITITNNCFNPGIVASGTIFTANSGLQFESTSDAAITPVALEGGNCNNPSTADVPVRAVGSGDQYNLAPIGYSIESYATSDVSGFGGQMSGGTTEIVKVVTADDVAAAERKLEAQDEQEIQNELKEQFSEDLFAIGGTFKDTSSKPKSTPAVGEEAVEASVTAQITYTMLGVNRDKLNELLTIEQTKLITDGQQSILDTGLDEAIITVDQDDDKGRLTLALRTSAYAGPEIDTEALASEISGKRYSEVLDIVESKAGVNQVEVDFNPFWVFNAPKASKITINVEISEFSLQ